MVHGKDTESIMQKATDLKQMIKNDIDSFPSLKPGTETSLGSTLFITNFAETVPALHNCKPMDGDTLF